MRASPVQLQADIETLQRLNAQGKCVAVPMNEAAAQWRIFREGYKPCFLSLTTGAVTQGGRLTKARGLSEALALVGIAL